MAETLEGVVQGASAPTNGASQTPSAQSDVQKYVPSADPSAQSEGGNQGGNTNAATDELVRSLQSEKDKIYADNLRLQNQMMELQTKVLQTQTPQVQQNPHDPAVNWAAWIQWENQQMAMKAAELARQGLMQDLMGLAQQQGEAQWRTQHPDADVESLKMIAKARYGTQTPTMQMIEDVYTLTRLPNTVNAARTDAINQTYNNFRQSQQAPSTVRGGVSGGSNAPATVDYVKLAQEYQATNGRAYDNWHPEIQKFFDRQTWVRDQAERKR